MPKRREHNRFVRIYDPEFAGRPGAYDGIPCARCSLPLLVYADRDEAGRLVHINCAEPPPVEDVELYLLLHEAGQTGEDIEVLRNRHGDREVRRRAEAYRRTWLEWDAPSRASRRPGPDIIQGAKVENEEVRALALTHGTSQYATLGSELARVLESFRRQLLADDSARSLLSVRTTRVAADAAIRLLSARVTVDAVPDVAGPFSIVVASKNRREVIDLLRELTGASS